MESNQDIRQIALDQAVSYAKQWGNSDPSSAVKAAEVFEAFLCGEHIKPPLPTLAEVIDAHDRTRHTWADPRWRQDFLRGIVSTINNRLTWPDRVRAIGDLTEVPIDERLLVKGVRGYDIHHLAVPAPAPQAQGDAAVDLTIDTLEGYQSNVFEIGPFCKVEHRFEIHEDRIATASSEWLSGFVEELIAAVVASLDSQVIEAVDELLSSAGWSSTDELSTPPFRVEFGQFDGYIAKEWVDQGGEYWHLWIRGRIGGAAFTLPGL